MNEPMNVECGSVVESLENAIETVEEGLENVGERKNAICKEIQSALVGLAMQPCGARLVCQIDGDTDASSLEFALIGDFPDWDDPNISRFVLRLREICDGDFAREDLVDWLSPEALSLVLSFEPEILRVRTECRYLKRLHKKLWLMKQYAEDWIGKRKCALEEIDHYFKAEV